MRLKMQQEPTWMWRYKHHSEVLVNIWTYLTQMLTDSIPDVFIKKLNVNLQPLDFFSGKTVTDPAASFDPFFMPTDKKVLQKKKNKSIEHTVNFPPHLGKPHKATAKPTSQDLDLQKDLVEELQKFCLLAESYPVAEKMTHFDRPSNANAENIRTLAGSVPFQIPWAMEYKQGARVITLAPEAYPDPVRPSATEVEVLIAIITQGLRQQSDDLGLSNSRIRNILHLGFVNFVIPALIISVYPGAQVRVLYGYMVNNQLYLHFTKLQQFTENNFQKMLEATLLWAFPIARGQAAKLITLPDIMEEEQEAVEGEDWEDLEDVESEEDDEDCTLHVYTKEEGGDGHVKGTRKDCMLNVSNTSTVTATSSATRKSRSKKPTRKGRRRGH
ncbi:uncharacterized protein N7496_012702 [Penicillium cataractarum]|uniref:Uncharacterized protein n=1 Tax=Penicillium cataractarum TaxID=2100454 RepID=A0A9W9R869_9EURO|nr:uncharacterized protein N7496_012702 [Penicillium cataractarum]KAJ5355490.1 hypothetical protein N7496_012702 [Penicillium cataractarum]